MALLEQLRTNLLSLSEEEGIVMFSEYYHRREREIQEIPTMVERKKREKKETKERTKGVSLKLSSTEIAVLKQLGLL